MINCEEVKVKLKMRFKCRVLFLFFYFFLTRGVAQESNTRVINFHPVFNNSAILFDEAFFKLSNSDSIQFETLKFYISSVAFLNNDKPVWKEKNSFHLIDASEEKTLSVTLKAPANILFNSIKFNLGIDSITNSSGAMGGDLDPTKGMYWTWQNGYINFKLEGTSNLCKTRKNEFQFHLGGYQYPYNSLQTIVLKTNSQEKIDVTIDLEKLISSIDLERENQIMSPCKEAVMLSKQVSDIFSVQVK
jgi:hypothetical protein